MSKSYQIAQAIQTDSSGFPLTPDQAAAPQPSPVQPYVAPAVQDTQTAVAVQPAAGNDPIPSQPVNAIALFLLVAVVLIFFAVHIGAEVSRSKKYWSGLAWGFIAFFSNVLMLPAGLVYLQWLGVPEGIMKSWGWSHWIASILTISMITWVILQLIVKILPDDPPANLQRQQGAR